METMGITSDMNHKAVAASLRQAQRDLLVRHIDGETFVNLQCDVRTKGAHPTMRTLMDLKLIRYSGWKSVQTSRLTEDGRMVLAYLLASYADALIQAGYGIEPSGRPAIAAVVKRLSHPGLSTVVTSHPPQSAPTESSAIKV